MEARSRVEKKGSVQGVRGLEKGSRAGRVTKTPAIQHSANVFAQGTLFF